MPPPISQGGAGPSNPQRVSLNILFLKSPSPKAQRLKFVIDLRGTDSMFKHGGRLTVVHVLGASRRAELFTLKLPPQVTPPGQSAAMNFTFNGQAVVDLTSSKNFVLEWSSIDSQAVEKVQTPLAYPESSVHA